jgi:hypothetical protein
MENETDRAQSLARSGWNAGETLELQFPRALHLQRAATEGPVAVRPQLAAVLTATRSGLAFSSNFLAG